MTATTDPAGHYSFENLRPGTMADLQLDYGRLSAINARTWIIGVVSRGFYPPAALQDKSTSVHGKPAADILWYWYPRLLGIVK